MHNLVQDSAKSPAKNPKFCVLVLAYNLLLDNLTYCQSNLLFLLFGGKKQCVSKELQERLLLTYVINPIGKPKTK